MSKYKWLAPVIATSIIVGGVGGTAHAKEWNANSPDDVSINGPSYNVEWGDTLTNLAIASDSDVESIVQLNQPKIQNPDLILAQDNILLPVNHDFSTNNNHDGGQKTVKSSQTSVNSSDIRDLPISKDVYSATSTDDKESKDVTAEDLKDLPLKKHIYKATSVD